MGTFNTLPTEITCSGCGEIYPGEIQFKYGLTWQLRYNIGERLRWENVASIGVPGTPRVRVYGVLQGGACPNCRQENPYLEYDIYVVNDVITSVSLAENVEEYLQVNFGDYIVLPETE